jgi:CheY-like chemotaxis protein
MLTILVIEDNELNRDMLTRRLSRRGFRVISAECGEQGVAMARAEHPDLVLMDLRLPDISGFDATMQLKQHDSTHDIPIIVVSAHAMETHRQQALDAGCDDYDTKPVEFERLLVKIHRLLKMEEDQMRQAI